MTGPVTPPGWPTQLPAPGTPEFRERVVAWLLDLAPAEFRGYPVFRKHPEVLAWSVANHLDGAVESLRRSYSEARATFHDRLEAPVVQQVLEAYEFEGVRLSRAVREVALVMQALGGTRWQPRL